MPINKVVFGGEPLIDLSNDTVDEANLVSGYTAHDKHGKLIKGKLTPVADTVGGWHFSVTESTDTPSVEKPTITLCIGG